MWEDKKDLETRNRCLERAIELIDITKEDSKNYIKLQELDYIRKIIADRYISRVYNTSLNDLEKYCLDFALVANKNR